MSTTGETFRLLQPGLMSLEELKDIISQRGVRVKGFENKPKHELVDIYERLLLPLSQRIFPENRLGKLINKKIAEENRKRSKNEPQASKFQYGFDGKSSRSSVSATKHHSSSSSTSSSYRLKPPIDSSRIEAKKICLSRQSSSDKSLDKIVIKDRSKKSADSGKEKDVTQSTHALSSPKSDRKPTDVKMQSSPEKKPKEESKDEPKQKRRKIAWP